MDDHVHDINILNTHAWSWLSEEVERLLGKEVALFMRELLLKKLLSVMYREAVLSCSSFVKLVPPNSPRLRVEESIALNNLPCSFVFQMEIMQTKDQIPSSIYCINTVINTVDASLNLMKFPED